MELFNDRFMCILRSSFVLRQYDTRPVNIRALIIIIKRRKTKLFQLHVPSGFDLRALALQVVIVYPKRGRSPTKSRRMTALVNRLYVHRELCPVLRDGWFRHFPQNSCKWNPIVLYTVYYYVTQYSFACAPSIRLKKYCFRMQWLPFCNHLLKERYWT
jgi:hypothetical protein